MSRVGVLWFLAVCTAAVASEGPAALLASGKYSQARASFEAELKARPGEITLVLGLAKTQYACGDWDQALATLGTLEDPRALALAAEIHYQRGNYANAQTVLNRAPRDAWCQALSGLAYKAVGDTASAKKTFAAVSQLATEAASKSCDLWALAVASQESADFQGAMDHLSKAQELDPHDMRARVLTGDLFFSKYQVQDALSEYKAALKQNPTDSFALQGSAAVATEHGRFAEAREQADKALAVNPRLWYPHVLKARMYEFDEDYPAMARELEAAAAANPHEAEILARQAACHYLQGDMAAYEASLKACLSERPRYATAYWILGDSCGQRLRVDEAEKFFKQALEIEPDLADAETSLGNLYMREGREADARVRLERSYTLDQYDYRTVNYLKLLDYLDREFSITVSPHFIFKVDELREGYLADVFVPHLEGFYPELLKKYCFSPKDRVTVEFFPRHDWFAARISGVPWIGITGGCFGRVIAADSPQVSQGTSHRLEVLRHEITHAINLQQTDRKLPMWLAEGLAVQEESSSRAEAWQQLLKRAVAIGDLLPLAQLNSGFTRAKNMAQRQLAYYQASLVVADIKQRHGFQSLLKLLEELRQGKEMPAAVPAALGIPYDQLGQEADAAWKAAAAASVQRAIFVADDLKALAARATTGTVEPWCDLAWANMLQGRPLDAVAALRKVVIAGKGPAPAQALAGDFMLGRKHVEKAEKHYQDALAQNPKEYAALLGLAHVAQERNDAKAAAEQFRRASAAYPDMLEPHKELLKFYQERKDSAGQLAELRELTRLELHKADHWHERAQLELEQGDAASAMKTLEQLVFIDTSNPHVYELRAKVNEALGKPQAAVADWTLAYRLQVYPYKPASKPGTGLDLLQKAVQSEQGLRKLGAILACGPLDSPEAATFLTTLMQADSGEPGHKAALALGGALDPHAVPGLIAALKCGDCGAAALRALRRLTARDFPDASAWTAWYEPRQKRPRQDWVLEGFEAAGFKAKWGESKEEVPALLRAISSGQWWIRENAWRELAHSAKSAYGRGAFGPHDDDREWEPFRKAAIAQFEEWWKNQKQ